LSRSPHNRIRDIEAAVAAIKQFEQAGRDEPVVFDAVRMWTFALLARRDLDQVSAD
jgi:hypothetical protein